MKIETKHLDPPKEGYVRAYFSFGVGHTSNTGEDLLGSYNVVDAPDPARARWLQVQAHGIKWGHEYADDPALGDDGKRFFPKRVHRHLVWNEYNEKVFSQINNAK